MRNKIDLQPEITQLVASSEWGGVALSIILRLGYWVDSSNERITGEFKINGNIGLFINDVNIFGGYSDCHHVTLWPHPSPAMSFVMSLMMN